MSLAAAPPAVARGARVCRRITRHHARTFYFASACLPRATRAHAYAVYGFCRWADDGVDHAVDRAQAAERLCHARRVLDRVYDEDDLDRGLDAPAGLLAFRRTVRARSIPKHLFEALLDGMEMDLDVTRYADFAALDLYCYRVAGVVGLMMTHVFGYRTERVLPQRPGAGDGDAAHQHPPRRGRGPGGWAGSISPRTSSIDSAWMKRSIWPARAARRPRSGTS